LTTAEDKQVNGFLELGKLGNHAWWHYLLGLLLTAYGYIVGTIISFTLMRIANGGKELIAIPFP